MKKTEKKEIIRKKEDKRGGEGGGEGGREIRSGLYGTVHTKAV